MSRIDRYLKDLPKLKPAVVCYLVQGNKVLLGLRKTSSVGLGIDIVAGLGGKVGDHEEFKGESVEEALEREVLEEIKVKITSYEHMGRVTFIFPNKVKWNLKTEIFLIDKWEGEPSETESTKPVWYDIDRLPIKQMWEDNPYWVPLVLKGQRVNAFFIYKKDNKAILEKRIKLLNK